MRRVILFVGLALILVGGGFAGGFALARSTSTPTPSPLALPSPSPTEDRDAECVAARERLQTLLDSNDAIAATVSKAFKGGSVQASKAASIDGAAKIEVLIVEVRQADALGREETLARALETDLLIRTKAALDDVADGYSTNDSGLISRGSRELQEADALRHEVGSAIDDISCGSV